VGAELTRYSDKTNVLFDGFMAIDGTARDHGIPRLSGIPTADMTAIR